MYLAGPAGLINHACPKHATCILDFERLCVEVNVSSLEAGQRIYYTYSDESDMHFNRGIACTTCRYENTLHVVWHPLLHPEDYLMAHLFSWHKELFILLLFLPMIQMLIR